MSRHSIGGSRAEVGRARDRVLAALRDNARLCGQAHRAETRVQATLGTPEYAVAVEKLLAAQRAAVAAAEVLAQHAERYAAAAVRDPEAVMSGEARTAHETARLTRAAAIRHAAHVKSDTN